MKIEDNFARKEALFNNKFQIGNIAEDTNNKTSTFGDVLKQAINDTNDKIIEADGTTNAFIRGDDVNIDEVMIKNQEASLCLQFLTQTRDKLLEGYDTLSKLQL